MSRRDQRDILGYVLSNVAIYAAVIGFCVWWTA